jgi:hypothetical protein
MKKELKIIIYSFSFLLFIFIALFFLIPNKCNNDFKTYSEKGYCEFNLKTCEGLFGCKEHSNIQVPCGSVSTLCGEKILCDCDDLSNNKIVEPENDVLFTVTGEFVCLPVKDKDRPRNDLCVHGIKGTNNDYYRLQAPSDDKNNVVNKIKKGQKIEISGELISEESDTYEIIGTIKVAGVKYLYNDEEDIEPNLPDSFKADYISFQDYNLNIVKVDEYPEELWVENGEIECNETFPGSSLAIRINKREINGKKYCVMASSEGAAGSVYTQYAYFSVIGDNIYIIKFTARYNSCLNYPEEEIIKCTTERENYNLDILIDREIEKIKI